MMIELPEDYEPFETLVVCSNTMKGGGHILIVGKHPVLLVGKGVLPLIWCSVPASNSFTKWNYIVERNTSAREILKVVSSRQLRQVTLSIDDRKILRVLKTNDNEAEVDVMDLRPVGFDVHGDKSGLWVGGNVLKGNIFVGARSIIGLSLEQMTGA